MTYTRQSSSFQLLWAAALFTFLTSLITPVYADYTVSAVTTCMVRRVPRATGKPPSPNNKAPQSYTVTVPGCGSCDCSTCTYTQVYTTTVFVDGPSGSSTSTAVISEIFTGMSTAPSATALPWGFTTTTETCTTCGPTPVVQTNTIFTPLPTSPSSNGDGSSAQPSPGASGASDSNGSGATATANTGAQPSNTNAGSAPQPTATGAGASAAPTTMQTPASSSSGSATGTASSGPQSSNDTAASAGSRHAFSGSLLLGVLLLVTSFVAW